MNIELEMPSYEIAQITDLTVALEPVQENDYDSVWPAGGGKNKFNKDAKDANNGYIDNSYLNRAGGIITNNAWYISEYIALDASTQYVLSDFTGYSPSVAFYDSSKGLISAQAYAGVSPIVFTTPASTAFVRISVYKSQENSAQLEAGATATAYSPYSNICPITGHSEVNVYNGAVYGTADDTYTISLGDTIYGGTLDVLTGVLTVDRAIKTLSQSDSFTMSQSTTRNRIAWNGYESVGKKGGLFVSNTLKSMPASSGGYGTSDWEVWGSTSAPRCWISVPLSYTINDFKEWLSNNSVQLVYELATPTTVQLTAQDVETLTGINNVWSDSGNVSVTIYGTTQTGDVVTVTALPMNKIQLFMP